ncbi:Alpha-L-arabinofuranosidase 1 [Acorus gramineus]|uniref:non-reducing end alpha-L-arabinofuranosidase n=1 Tax=Acorus gramineus TaxID=55184 RepID=A0AAV9A0A6_ACOGR|nr:Alpha-L-arabinofuranosidase 1 [Acorus gramineus]
MDSFGVWFFGLFALFASFHGLVFGLEAYQSAQLSINASRGVGRQIPETLFGQFFEEINHAGAGGLWAELVSNRGFEAGGPNTPSNIDPWTIIGDYSIINVSTDRSSCFSRNIIALRMDILCDCPSGGVGVYNPGYWGMNIEQGKTYKVVFYAKSLQPISLTVSLTSSDGTQILASANIESIALPSWTKWELLLNSTGTDHSGRLQLTTTRKGVIWLDQVSAMPTDTYKGHGFRKDLFGMLADLKPRFLRFPGGCFVEGEWLRNAFRWKQTIGPWEERPGHFGDVWMYWTDDGLGYFEFLQLSEDLGAAPVWVFNNGISHNDEVDTSSIIPFVQDVLDSIEFARGPPDSEWGRVRAVMGHPEPFPLQYIAIGNEDCWKPNYRGNYLKFYNAIKDVYPDISLITNCDGSSQPLDHPADLYDFHIYTSANNMFSMAHQFDKTSRFGPKAFVSEYAVTGKDAGTGSLLAALAEGAFLIGLEKNSDVVKMASYAPLFVNSNDRRWNPDAIVFNSWQHFGTPSYWVQQFFSESSGATILPVTTLSNQSLPFIASAITRQSVTDNSYYLRIKIVNFGSNTVNLKMSLIGLGANAVNPSGSTCTTLTSTNLMDENSFATPNKVVPRPCVFTNADVNMNVVISPYSFTSYDVSLSPSIEPAYKSDFTSYDVSLSPSIEPAYKSDM